MRKTFLLCMSLIVISSHSWSDEVITEFDEKTVPVLNEELRKIDVANKQVEDRVAVLEATPTTIAATQAEMEATTNTIAFVSPARAQYHQSAVKAWVRFNGDVGNGAITPTSSYNVSALERTAEGTYTITWDTDFSGTTYTVVASAINGTSVRAAAISAAIAGSCTLLTGTPGVGLEDGTIINAVAFGDQ